jgi:glycosyltransferase involved in cell wall biosynthesis
MLYGMLSVSFGFALYICCFLWAIVAYVASGPRPSVWLAFAGGAPTILGIVLVYIELAFQLPKKRVNRRVTVEPIHNQQLTVVLTAYNDEESIGSAVRDFLSSDMVRRVLVIDNNSADRTSEVAANAGAIVHRELAPGYGNCVYRALEEASRCTDTELVLLCEGDMTFRAFDIDKFLAYAPHAEIVNGTRIVEQLRDRKTQLTTFMYYGNFVAGKLLELKHIGRGTFTDVGTTYKLCRTRALDRLLPHLNRKVNLEFNAHFLDTALRLEIDIVECPITFFARVGQSKGGNVNNLRALKVGLRMILGMLGDWRMVAQD